MTAATAEPKPQDVTVSRVQQIADLAVGASFAVSERLDGDEATKGAIRAARERLRNSLAPATKRAADRTGNTYTTENGEISTRSLDILVVTVVTRVS